MVESRSVRGERSNSGASLRSAASDPGLNSSSSSALSSGGGTRINTFVSNAQGSFGSNMDLSMTATRPLGSGSLCDERLDECDSVNVVVRCRPLSDKEENACDDPIIQFPGEGQIWVNVDGTNGKAEQEPKKFTYNVVFENQSTQQDILEHSGITKLLMMAVDGFSCTVFCYGQTGSGKTHTLTGPPNLFESRNNIFSEDQGLIFRCFVFIFDFLESFEDREFTIKASFLEIYNEKVIDLLNMGTNQKPLQVRWNKKRRGFFVDNLFSIECYELDDLCAVLEEGLRNRAVASHSMNEYSSRSHTILTVEITSEQKAEEGVIITKNGKINFVDLAGSEMTKKTNSEGKTLEEANNINKSLLVLGTCISNLSDPKKRDGHIPYRDSKLTKLLADSLAGSGVTLMIACVSPSKSNLSETLNTLRYATRAKRIKTKPIVIMDPKEKAILALKREVNELQEENQHLKMLLDVGPTADTPPGLASFLNGTRTDRLTTPEGQISALALSGTVGNSHALRAGLQEKPAQVKVDEKKLRSLDPQELIALVKKYVGELDTVKKENKELQMVSLALVTDQEQISKENERLQHRLEDLQRGIQRSALGSARSVAERLATRQNNRPKEKNNNFTHAQDSRAQVWVNPLNSDATDNKKNGSSLIRQRKKVPDSINKEIEKRRIGRSLTDLRSSGSSRGNSGGGDQNKSAGNNFVPKRPQPKKTKRPKPVRSRSLPRAEKASAERMPPESKETDAK